MEVDIAHEYKNEDTLKIGVTRTETAFDVKMDEKFNGLNVTGIYEYVDEDFPYYVIKADLTVDEVLDACPDTTDENFFDVLHDFYCDVVYDILGQHHDENLYIQLEHTENFAARIYDNKMELVQWI